jgi:hypothetical protein
MVLLTLLVLAGQQPAQKAVTLSRIFAAGEKYSYDVKSHLTLENRALDIETFIPIDYDLNYAFTAEVKQMKTDGIAVIHYQRPTMTEVEGTVDTTRPAAKTQKVNFNFTLIVSPINEILDREDVRAAPPARKSSHLMTRSHVPRQDGADEVRQFVTELYRLALFNGPVESSLDFSPKFPFWDVVPGDTWKRTAGYQPQALRGKRGQQPVQRLDYTYTYRGLVSTNGKAFQRVTAALNLNTDLAPWARQYMDPGSGAPSIAKMPMNLKASIEFDLDPKTFSTVAARAHSQGGFKVYMSNAPNQVFFESRLKGTTTLSLRSLTR